MPTNTTLRNTLNAQYQENDTRIAARQSAVAVINSIVNLNNVEDVYKRNMINHAIWMYTATFPGNNWKYGIKFRSQEALAEEVHPVIHEHVFKREYLVNAILEAGSVTPEIEGKFIACVVSRNENIRLREVDRDIPGIDGWKRYRAANVLVKDTSQGTAANGFEDYKY